MSMSMSMSMSMATASSSSMGAMSSSSMSMASSNAQSTMSASMSGMSMSSSMDMPTSTVAESSSSMSMSMSDMGSSTASSMSMSMAGMNMGSSTSSSSTSTGMPSSGDDMSDMNMSMNSYLTPTYKNYPILFHKLSADTKGKAFGIFLLLVVAAFVYKCTLFVSWCLEVKWFKKWNKNHKPTTAAAAASGGLNYYNEDPLQTAHLPRLPNFVFHVFKPSSVELAHDFIRAILTFISTMLVYMLMLAAMSFVLTYVFAVITGLALAEVFFNRCKICMLQRWEIQAQIERAKSGENDCQCNPDDNKLAVSSTNEQSVVNEKEPSSDGHQEAACCCTDKAIEQEKEMENNIMENSKLQEQSGNMDSNLLPAEKFR